MVSYFSETSFLSCVFFVFFLVKLWEEFFLCLNCETDKERPDHGVSKAVCLAAGIPETCEEKEKWRLEPAADQRWTKNKKGNVIFFNHIDI